MSPGGLSERGNWHSESDIKPRTIEISSEEELEKLKTEEAPGIVVVDGDLFTSRNAAEMADVIRKKYGSSWPITYLSTRPTTPEERIEFLDNGGDAILTGEDRDLLPKVLTTLARRMRLDAESRAPLKPFDGFVIDRHSHTLSVHNQPVPLTSFEFKFLYLLAEKYPAIVSRDEITENIYSGDLPSSKTIEVFVSRLRKKILPFAINTVLDEGYGLSEKPDLAYQKRSRGFDEEGNELIVVDAIDRYILELAMNSVRFQEISEMVDTRFGSETNRNMIAGRVRDRFGGLRRISAERLVKPATPDGEWLYKRPPR